MARTKKHEVLREVTVDCVSIWAREIEILTQLATTAFDGNLVPLRTETTSIDETRNRMEAIGYCLQQIAELSHNLVSASNALIREAPVEIRN